MRKQVLKIYSTVVKMNDNVNKLETQFANMALADQDTMEAHLWVKWISELKDLRVLDADPIQFRLVALKILGVKYGDKSRSGVNYGEWGPFDYISPIFHGQDARHLAEASKREMIIRNNMGNIFETRTALNPTGIPIGTISLFIYQDEGWVPDWRIRYFARAKPADDKWIYKNTKVKIVDIQKAEFTRFHLSQGSEWIAIVKPVSGEEPKKDWCI